MLKTSASSPRARMGTVELRLGLVCNQHCVHCSRHTTQRDPHDASNPLQLLEELLQRQPGEVIVTGGEPTLSPHLPTVLARCQAAGVTTVLETNGLALASPTNRNRLQSLGLLSVRLHWPAGDHATYTAVTRDERGFELATAALAGLRADGFAVTLVVPVLSTNLQSLQGLADDPRLKTGDRMALRLFRQESPSVTAGLHPHPHDTERVLADLRVRLQDRGITANVEGGLPACLLRAPDAAPWLIARTDKPTSLPAVCDTCSVAKTCPGPAPGLLAAHPDLTLAPLRSTRTARQVAALQPHSQPEDNYLREIVELTPAGEPVVRELLLRVVQQCNERCQFCWVDFEAPPCPDAVVARALARLREVGSTAMLSLTGGEPLLHKDLASIVAQARAAGAWAVQLQTNATLVTARQAAALAQAGLTHALVGFHAADPQTYARITQAAQLYERALAGIVHLLDAGIEVTVNCVLSTENLSQAPQIAKQVAQLRGQRGQRPLLSFAAAAEIAGGPLQQASLPRLSEVAGPLREALSVCLREGQPFSGLAHPCGVPPCILGADLRYYPDLLRWRVAEEAYGDRPAACQACVMAGYCPGLRPEYRARHGDDELQPLATWPAAPVTWPVPQLPLAPPDRPLHALVVGAGRMGLDQARWLADSEADARVAVLSRRENPSDGANLPARVAVHPRQVVGSLAGIDLVSICTETQVRAGEVAHWLDRIAELPAADRPWLLIEKPLAEDAQTAHALADRAAQRGVTALVQHSLVASPGWRAIRRALPPAQVTHMTMQRSEPSRPGELNRDPKSMLLQHLLHEASLLVDLLTAGDARDVDWTRPLVSRAALDLQHGSIAAEIDFTLGHVVVQLRAAIGGDGAGARTVEMHGDAHVAVWREVPGQRQAVLRSVVGGQVQGGQVQGGQILGGQILGEQALDMAGIAGRSAAVLHVAQLARMSRGRRDAPLDDPLARALHIQHGPAVVALAEGLLAAVLHNRPLAG